MQQELILTDKSFKQEILESEIPVLVDFWASWCPPCKMIEPVISQMADELNGKIKVRKINVDQNPETAADFSIAGVPTFILFNQGKEMKREVGARSRQQLLRMIVDGVQGK